MLVNAPLMNKLSACPLGLRGAIGRVRKAAVPVETKGDVDSGSVSAIQALPKREIRQRASFPALLPMRSVWLPMLAP